ncbi:hypothetical protein JVU11DRAFT_8930 [Chiua virens]|nr:hypothetical protein JVU11DRAFT_8930 [Chiua virens]
MKNKDDSHVLIRNCKAICSTLALATKDVSVDRMNDVFSNGLSELKSYVSFSSCTVPVQPRPHFDFSQQFN